MTLLRVEGLGKSFGGVQALDGPSFEVAPGELVALIGPNGAGKSTCFNIINGQMHPDRGRVLLDGRNVAGRAPRELFRMGVGRTFQVTQTFGSMSVRENLQVALSSAAREHVRWWQRAQGRFAAQVQALLEAVDMASQADRACAVLSYGDLKRVELALALAGTPRLLLMDEPTAGMAPQERQSLMTLTAKLARERRLAVLFTEHDMDIVFGHADRVLVLDHGRLIAEGTPALVREHPQVRRVYLGA